MSGIGSVGSVGAVGGAVSLGPVTGIASLGAAPAMAAPPSIAAPDSASSEVSISATARAALNGEVPTIATTASSGSTLASSARQINFTVNSNDLQDTFSNLERDLLEINRMDELVAALLLALLLRHNKQD